jgi:hypothetical protein
MRDEKGGGKGKRGGWRRREERTIQAKILLALSFLRDKIEDIGERTRTRDLRSEEEGGGMKG